MLASVDLTWFDQHAPWLAPMLPWLAGILLIGGFFSRRAPAVSLALLGGVIGFFVGPSVAIAFVSPFIGELGPESVPVGLAAGAVGGVILLGVIGVLATRPAASPRFLRRAAGTVCSVGIGVVWWTSLMLVRRCELRGNPERCLHDEVLIGLALATPVLLALLLLASAEKAGRSV